MIAGRSVAATEHCADPGNQFGKNKRFDHVVVCTGFEPGDAIVDRVARTEHADRDFVAGGTKRRHHTGAVEHRHVDVEDYRVRSLVGDHSERVGAVHRRQYGESREPQSAFE